MRQVPGAATGNDSNVVNTCSLHPNPCTGRFCAVMQYPVKNAEIYITDIKGAVLTRVILNGTKADLDISRYAPGTYIMRLKSGNYQYDVKVVKE